MPGQEGGQGVTLVRPVLLRLAQAVHQHQGGAGGPGETGEGAQHTSDQGQVRTHATHLQTEHDDGIKSDM